jgi:hypothetical protein
LKSFVTLQGFAKIVVKIVKRQEQSMSDDKLITPLGQSVFFAYVDAYAKKHNITRDQAIEQISKGDGGVIEDGSE